MPEVDLLSNGAYHVMIAAAGGGYSRSKDLAVTRWREDAALDNWGCDHEIETRTEIAVSIDDDVELRRVPITNLSERCRTLDATSYAEIVLSAPGTDSAHPAFSNFFIEAEIDTMQNAIFTTRRPSAPDDPTPWLFHLARARDSLTTAFSYENLCFRTASTSPGER
jgi:cyclic beta-1,2-glucan synthetase